MPLYVPSKLIIFVSTIVSTFISLLAGYLLYAESISVLRSAVDENSAAVSKSARLRLAGMLNEITKSAYEARLMFNRDDVLNVSLGLRHVEKVYAAQAFATLRSSDELYSVGYFLFKKHKPWDDPEGYSRHAVWYEPILDGNGNNDKFWISGNTLPTVVDGKAVRWQRSFTAKDNETGVLVPTADLPLAPPVLNLTWETNVTYRYEWMQSIPYNGTWSPTYFWNSVDGSPYAYNSFFIRYTPPWAEGTHDLVLVGYFMYRPWTSVIREFEAASTHLVVLDCSAFQVFTSTVYEGLAALKPECFTACFSCTDYAGKDCVMNPNDLGPTVSGAVNASKPRPRGTFFTADLSSTNMRTHVRYGEYFAASDVNKTTPLYKKDYFVDTSLDGGEYFLRLTHVYTAAGTTFELLWMRSVSSVNDKVYAALVQLIIASVVIFVVDLIIAVLEIVLIARPLGRLVVGNRFLETMELDDATAHMKSMYKPVMVQEVKLLTDGLLMAIKCLREFKAFLPQSLFVNEDDDASIKAGSEIVALTETSESTDAHSKAKQSKVLSPTGNVLMTMQSYKGTVVKLCFTAHMYVNFPEGFAGLVEVVNEAVTSSKGLAHGFSVANPFNFTLTWNIGLRCVESITRGVGFCKFLSGSQRVASIATPVMSVVHGVYQAGNLGSFNQRGFGMTGASLQELGEICAVADVVVSKLPQTITLVSPAVCEGIMGRYGLSAVALLRTTGSKAPIVVNAVGHIVTSNVEEWMYQLQEAEVLDPVAEALKQILINPSIKPIVNIEKPTDIQRWAISNIEEGRAVMNFTQQASNLL